MKAEKIKEPFKPVLITLESQEEVDALIAVFSHRTLADTVLEMPKAMDVLDPFGSPSGYRKYFERFEKHFKCVE